MTDLERMHALASGELDGDDKAQAERLCADDPACRAEHEWAALVRETVRTRCDAPKAEDQQECWSACQERLNAIDGTKRSEGFIGRFAWGLCGLFIVAIALAAGINRMGPPSQVSSQNMAGLVSGFSGSLAPNADSIGPESGVMTYEMPPRFEVHEVRYGEPEGIPTFRYQLSDQGGNLTLFIIQGYAGIEGLEEAPSGFHRGQINTANVVSWAGDDTTAVLMGPRSLPELELAAERIRGPEQRQR